MSNDKIRELRRNIDTLEQDLNALVPPYDFSQVEDQLKNLKELYENIETLIQDINNEIDMEESSSRRPLINRFKEYKTDFDILKKEYNRKVNEISTVVDQILLMKGELHGEARTNAQRNMALQQIKVVDEQGNLIDGIAKNVDESMENIKRMKVELKKQDEKLDVIVKKVEKMEEKVDETAKIFDGMEKRLFCRKILLWVALVLLFLFDLIFIFLIIAKAAHWPPYRRAEENQVSNLLINPALDEQKEMNGIIFNFNEDLDLNEFENKGLSFIVLKAEEDTSIQDKIIENIDKAKEKNIKVALYWYINKNEEIGALEEVNKAINFLKKLNEKGKELQLGFYYKFSKENNLQTNYNIINNFCKDVIYDCGIALSYNNFKTNYKDNLGAITKIKNYLIDSEGEFIDDSDKKLIAMWNAQDTVSIKNDIYNIIKSLE